ncbi:MAG: sulfite exporter TauE/SafE family protein [Candidatus Hodarchaeales archaeon]
MAITQFIGEPIVTDPIQAVFAIVFSFFVGILSSALGVGGGFITTPSLIILGIDEAYAVGTALFMIIFTALSSTFAYSRQPGLIEFRSGLIIATTTIIGSISGSITSSVLAVEDPQLFRIVFAVCLIPIAIKMILYPKERKKGSSAEEEIEHDDVIWYGYEKREIYSTVLGLIAGFSSGLLGIGGGVVMVPILVTIGKMPMHKAVATSMFIMIFTSIAGAGVKFTQGQTHPDLALFLIIGIVLGAQVGARLVKRVNTIHLQRIFGFMMIVALISIVI